VRLASLSGVTVRLVDLPRGVRGACRPLGQGRAMVVIDRRLGQVKRTAVLAHELVHLERGGPCPSGLSGEWWAVEAA
jgi:hypothetical protein